MPNRVVVITGASSGIGAATAELLGQRADIALALVARRKDALAAVAARCNGRARVIVADVERRAQVRRVADEAIAAMGHIDVWVNNAGRGISRPPSQLTDEDIDAMMSANVKSVLYGMQEVLPHFQARGDGHFINVSSILGRLPNSVFRSAYTASKFYLNALTAMMREEIQRSHPNIAFSIVSPGLVGTDFGLHALHGGPDSRTLPDPQDVREVATVIAGVVDTRAPDTYTRKGSRERVVTYYASNGDDPT